MRLLDNILLQARMRPDARAIVTADGHLGYGDLVSRAGSLAAGMASPAEPSRPVCIAIRKSPEAVIAMLATLLAGRAYLPLDSGLPEARRRAMIADSGADLMLVTEADAAAGASAAGTTCAVRTVPADPAGGTNPPAPVPVAASSDAALLYTSGSTNIPKGVRISRAAIDTFVDWATGYFGFGPEDRAASHAPFGFDISFLDLWAPLAAGGEVHLVPEGQMANGRFLLHFLAERGVTFWQSVPTPLVAIGTELGAGPLPAPLALRHLCSTGEALPEAARTRLAALGEGVTLHNVYGCTETNDTFVFSLPIREAGGEGQLPIGLGLAYVDYLIVDAHDMPVPQGEQGELLTASAAGFTGYTDPDLTRAAHVECDGQRYFRTRDLVAEDAYGFVHFIGRSDHTVKLRGVRVDLREIETVIGEMAGVQEALAMIQPCARKGMQLVVVISGPEAPQLPVIGLKAHCARHLARQVIPDRFITQIAPLPRNLNGKIDRRAVSASLKELLKQDA